MGFEGITTTDTVKNESVRAGAGRRRDLLFDYKRAGSRKKERRERSLCRRGLLNNN
jgi:hypothetical protein